MKAVDIEALSLGVTGLGGYAGWWCDELMALSAKSGHGSCPPVRLTAVCEPDLSLHAERAAKLLASGVTVVERLDDLLSLSIDAVWLPLPIDLHRTCTERCLASGKAVLVEKPAAGCVDDVDAMIAARDHSGLPVGVGFQNLFDPATWEAKRQLLNGAIGKPISAGVVGCWPRPDAYFARNGWAGKLKRNRVWVLDSPANNAMAHSLNLALFLLGSTEPHSATPVSVEAELYRVNPIENYDTCCIRYTLPGGIPLVVGFTHACRDVVHSHITITGDRGVLRFWHNDRFEFTSPQSPNSQARPEPIPADPNLAAIVVRGFTSRVRGIPQAHIATLENARAHTIAINGASETSVVQTIPSKHIEIVPGYEGCPMRTVPGIEAALMACVGNGRMLHESAAVPWSMPATKKDLRGYSHFRGPAAIPGLAKDQAYRRASPAPL